MEQLKGLAAACYVSEDRAQVMHNLWKRLESPDPKKWQKVAKALLVLDYVVLHGPEDVVLEVRRSAFRLNQLREFKYVQKNVDHGESVRTKAQKLSDLIKDDARVKEARDNAKRTSERITGGNSTSSASTSPSATTASKPATKRSREAALVDTGLSDAEVARRLQEQFDKEANAHGLTRAQHNHSTVSADEEEDILQQVMRISKQEAEAAERAKQEADEKDASVGAQPPAVGASQTSLFSSPAPVQQQPAHDLFAQPVPAAQQQQDLFAQPAAAAPQPAAQPPAQPVAAAPVANDQFDPFAPSNASPPPQAAKTQPGTIEDFFAPGSGGPSPAFDPRVQEQPQVMPEPLPLPQLAAQPPPQQQPQAVPQQQPVEASALQQKMLHDINMFSAGKPPSPVNAGAPKLSLAQMQDLSPTNQQQQPQANTMWPQQAAQPAQPAFPQPQAQTFAPQPANPTGADPFSGLNAPQWGQSLQQQPQVQPFSQPQPVAAQPVAAQPVVAQPVAAQPPVAQPVVAQPPVEQQQAPQQQWPQQPPVQAVSQAAPTPAPQPEQVPAPAPVAVAVAAPVDPVAAQPAQMDAIQLAEQQAQQYQVADPAGTAVSVPPAHVVCERV